MITIQNVVLDATTNSRQLIKKRGLQSVMGVTRVGKNIMATIVVNTSGDLERTAEIYLIETGADAAILLRQPKYIGSVGKYHLFLEKILPQR